MCPPWGRRSADQKDEELPHRVGHGVKKVVAAGVQEGGARARVAGQVAALRVEEELAQKDAAQKRGEHHVEGEEEDHVGDGRDGLDAGAKDAAALPKLVEEEERPRHAHDADGNARRQRNRHICHRVA